MGMEDERSLVPSDDLPARTLTDSRQKILNILRPIPASSGDMLHTSALTSNLDTLLILYHLYIILDDKFFAIRDCVKLWCHRANFTEVWVARSFSFPIDNYTAITIDS